MRPTGPLLNSRRIVLVLAAAFGLGLVSDVAAQSAPFRATFGPWQVRAAHAAHSGEASVLRDVRLASPTVYVIAERVHAHSDRIVAYNASIHGPQWQMTADEATIDPTADSVRFAPSVKRPSKE